MKKFLFLTCTLAWAATLFVNILALTGIDGDASFPSTKLIAAVALVLLISINFFLRATDEDRNLLRRAVSKDTPRLLGVLAIASFVYCIVNFILSLTVSTSPHDHLENTRFWSGTWLAYFGTWMAALYRITWPKRTIAAAEVTATAEADATVH